MSPVRRISARLAGSAFTFSNSISRSTWSSSERSVTLITSMSLWSCLSTCSMTKASPVTTIVIRDTDGSSVSPTDRLSMLYPRAEKSPATRESTPNLFSTSTAIVCFSTSTCLPFPCLRQPCHRPKGCRLPPSSAGFAGAASGSLASDGGSPAPRRPVARPASWGRLRRGPSRPPPSLKPRLRFRRLVFHLAGGRGQDHVLVGAAGGHHGEDALVLVDADVEHHRRRRADHLLDRRHDLAGLGAPYPDAAIGLGEPHVVGDAGKVDGEVALLVDDPLPLAHHAVTAVVADDGLDGKPLAEACGQLLAVHLERAVAVDVDDELVGVGGLHAHGRREAVAHGPQSPRRAPAPGVLEPVVLGGPHLMLPDSGHDERLALGRVRDLLDHVLGLDDLVAPVVAQREVVLPRRDLGRPLLADLGDGGGDPVLHLLLHGFDELRQHALAVADDRDVDLDVLGDRRRVDVDVDDLC